jgi:hypothetical protein
MTDTITFDGQELEVQMGVELPPRIRSNPNTDELADVPVGGYVFIPCEDEQKARTRVANRVRAVKKRFGGNYTTRNLEGGVGVWRTE